MLRLVWDNATQEGDLAVVRRESGVALRLEIGRGLDTAILLSLFTDRRALDTDDMEGDQRGFWGDSSPLVEGDIWGSRLWTLERAKVTNRTLRDAREMCVEALQWMIDDGIVARFEIETWWVRGLRGHLGIGVTAYRPDSLVPEYSGPWEQVYATQ